MKQPKKPAKADKPAASKKSTTAQPGGGKNITNSPKPSPTKPSMGKVAHKGQGSEPMQPANISGKAGEKFDSGAVDPTRPIGKGNPPRPKPEHQFKKGNVANPKGYPKGQPNTSTIIKYWLGQKEVINNPLTGLSTKVTIKDSIILAQLNKARKGDAKAAELLLDRTDGKPVQTNKLVIPGGKGLEITVGFKRPDAILPKPAATAEQKPKEDPDNETTKK